MRCLSCDIPIKGVTPADRANHEPPDELAVFVCTFCGHLMRMGDRGRFRELTNTEMQEVMMDDDLRAALAQIGKSRLS
jgi:hypothetical protein